MGACASSWRGRRRAQIYRAERFPPDRWRAEAAPYARCRAFSSSLHYSIQPQLQYRRIACQQRQSLILSLCDEQSVKWVGVCASLIAHRFDVARLCPNVHPLSSTNRSGGCRAGIASRQFATGERSGDGCIGSGRIPISFGFGQRRPCAGLARKVLRNLLRKHRSRSALQWKGTKGYLTPRGCRGTLRVPRPTSNPRCSTAKQIAATGSGGGTACFL